MEGAREEERRHPGVALTDSITYLAVSAGLIAVALGASLVPAARAAKVDPAITLRGEG